MRELGGDKTQVAALEAREVEQLAKIYAMQSHELGFLNKSRGLEHQLVMVRVEVEWHEAWEVESP